MKKILSMFLALCMVVTLLPVSAMAEEAPVTIGTSGEIIGFAPLTEIEKAVSLGTSMEDLELPETLTATVRTAVLADENLTQDSGSPETATPTTAAEPEWEETIADIPVTWTSSDYDPNSEGEYVFTPVIVGYTVSAELPELTVTVGEPAFAPLEVQLLAIEAGAVAAIDETGYATLQEAVDAVTEGQTIRLMEDIDLTNTVTIASGNTKSFILDLNGKTLESTGKSTVAIEHRNDGELTIKNSSGAEGMITSAFIGINNYSSGTVNISGGTVCTTGECEAILNGDIGTINLSGGTVHAASAYGIAIHNGYIGTSDGYIGTINLSGGTVSATGFSGIAIQDEEGIVNISGGTVSVTETSGVAIFGRTNISKLNISGGTVSAVSSLAINHQNTTIQKGTTIIIQGSSGAMAPAPTLDDGVQGVASTNYDGGGSVAYNKTDLATYKYLKFEPAATPIDNLEALQSAITDAAGDLNLKLSHSYSGTGTITIPDTCSHDITIDLNGQTLDGGSDTAIEYKGIGTLTITDGKGGGTVTSSTLRKSGSGFGTIVADGSGTLELLGGTVSNSSNVSNESGSAIYMTNYISNETTLNIRGGTVSVTGSTGSAVRALSNNINIYGGTISATGSGGNAIYIGGGQLNIYGGTMNSVGIAIYNESAAVTTIQNGTTVIIQGGTKAMIYAPTLDYGVQGGASTNYDGGGSVAYDKDKLSTYKYLKFGLDVISPVLSAGNVNRTSDTAATIGFTTDKAGTAYYLVVDSGATPPPAPMGVKVAGTSLGAVSVGAVTNQSVTLGAGAKDIYVVVEDSAGNISTPLKITAETYVAPDTTAPTVTSVTPPANGTYADGDNLDFTVNFDENVTVTGSPHLSLTVGSATRNAAYAGGTGTSALSFRYTVQAGDSDSNGVTVDSLTLNGGAIKDGAGNNATLALNNIGSTSGVLVLTPVPFIISQPSPQTVNEGATATFSVTATGASLTCQWQVNTGSGSGFVKVSDGGVYSGASTLKLTITGATAGMNGYQYRAVVTGKYSPAATSNSAMLTVNAAPVVNASISPATATFDLNPNGANHEAIPVTLTRGSHSLARIKKGETSLGSLFDYTVNGDLYTLTKSYLSSLPVGSTTITFQMNGGTSPTLTLTIEDTRTALTSVAVSDSTPTFGDTLSATIEPSAATITYSWKADGSQVSTGATYEVKAADIGKAITLTVTGTGSYKGTVTSTATSAVAAKDYSVYVDSTKSVAQGSGLSALPIAGAGKVSGTLTWYADSERTTAALDTDISSLSADGSVTLYWSFTAATAGYVTTPKTGLCTVTIVSGAAQTLSFAQSTVAKTVGDPIFTNVLTHSVGTGAVTYSSSNTSVATVHPTTGVVAIVGAGTTTITANAAMVPGEYAPGSASFALTVNAPAKSVSVGPQIGTATAGTSGSLTYTVTTANIADGTYAVNVANLPTGVTVGNSGNVTISGNCGTLTLTVADTAAAGTTGTLALTLNSATSAVFSIVIGEPTPATTYTITADPVTKDFGSLTIGYIAPAAQTVTITNTGNSSVTLTQPTSTNYAIGALSDTTLAANGTATFTVAPKTGLAVGNYNETLTVSTDQSTNATVELSFTVTAAPTYTVTFNPNGGTVSETSRSVAPGTAVGALPTPTRSGSYSFDGWYTAASGGVQISASTTVSETVTYHAHWTYTGGGGSGSGGESSSNDNSSPVIVTPPAPDKPNSPTQGEIKVPGTVDGKGNVTVSLTDKTVTDAFDKALAEAKKTGTEQNGITVVLRVDTGNKIGSNVTVNLPKAVQDTIIAKKIVNTIVVVDNPDIRVGMDLATVQEINKQAKSDVNITAARTDSGKLTGEAKKAIGSRPVFDLKVNYGNDKAVSSFGAGSVSVTIPYTLGANEKAGNVQAVYVDSKGKVHWLVNSVYDSVEKVLRFSTNHFSTYGIGYKQTGTAFADIAGHWAKEDIEFVASRGLFSGTSETKFSPNTAMTRGMFVTALGRLANADVSGYAKSSFSDVKDDAYYMGYIEWASKNNIVNGVGNGNFAPDQSITREQMAVIMSNYAKTIGYTLPKVHTENTFSDNGKISTYAKEAVKQMQMAGVISGKNGNLYDPQGTATRAEVSAVLRRFVELAISSDTAQGWTMNDSGKWMYYENGKPLTGKQDIDGATYTFDQYGVTADVPKNLRYTTYIVQKGDSFWRIAYKLGCTMSELERLNNKSRFSLILPGEVLRVPEK